MVGIDEDIPVVPLDQPAAVNVHVDPAALVQNQQVQKFPLHEDLPRARRTHKDVFISSLLSKLSLCEKLSKNKDIEDQNKMRELKKFNHHMDPALYPETGSENASFITINDAELKDLKDPSVFARFSNFI